MKIENFESFRLLKEAKIGENSSGLDVNLIDYGNHPQECQTISQKEDKIKNWFIQKGLAEKIKSEAPANDSEITKKDLQDLLKMTSEATSDDVTFARYADNVENLANLFIDLLKEHGHEVEMSEFFMIDSQTESLLFFLKDVINRPRPYQLAKAFNYPLYPLIKTDSMTASYPSGHALTGFVISEYFSQKYPEISTELKAMGEKIAHSREVTGIHYPSDTRISKEICDTIFKEKLLEIYS